MGSQKGPLEVLLLGSSPFLSADTFLKTTSSALSTKLHQIPDGETGPRSNFIAWQHSTLPISIIQPRWGGQPSNEDRTKTYFLEDIKPSGCDDQSIASYAIFCKLRAAGNIPSSTRFQVSLPTPLSVVRRFMEDDTVCANVDPLYEKRLLQALHRLQEQIPAPDLTIQWDLPIEKAILVYERGNTTDRYWTPYFAPVKEGILQRLSRLAAAVGSEVEMGYHLCYGDMGHVHFVEPADASLLVDPANAIVSNVGPIHQIAYSHLPVPKDKIDETYTLPLKQLELEGAKLFLGLVHAHDESGTKKRLETARGNYPQIAGLSTECGMGRTSVEDVESILQMCASVVSV